MGLAQPSDSTTFGRTDPLPESVSAYSNNACCVLRVVCCMLRAVCCALCVVCCMLHAVCCVLCVAGRLSAAPSPCPSQSARTAADAATIRQMPRACLPQHASTLPAARSRGMAARQARDCGFAKTGGPSQSRTDVAPADTAAARVRTARGAGAGGRMLSADGGTHCYHPRLPATTATVSRR